jgi:hypothetical protein
MRKEKQSFTTTVEAIRNLHHRRKWFLATSHSVSYPALLSRSCVCEPPRRNTKLTVAALAPRLTRPATYGIALFCSHYNTVSDHKLGRRIPPFAIMLYRSILFEEGGMTSLVEWGSQSRSYPAKVNPVKLHRFCNQPVHVLLAV